MIRVLTMTVRKRRYSWSVRAVLLIVSNLMFAGSRRLTTLLRSRLCEERSLNICLFYLNLFPIDQMSSASRKCYEGLHLDTISVVSRCRVRVGVDLQYVYHGKPEDYWHFILQIIHSNFQVLINILDHRFAQNSLRGRRYVLYTQDLKANTPQPHVYELSTCSSTSDNIVIQTELRISMESQNIQ